MTDTEDYFVVDRTGTPHVVVPIEVEIGGNCRTDGRNRKAVTKEIGGKKQNNATNMATVIRSHELRHRNAESRRAVRGRKFARKTGKYRVIRKESQETEE